MERDSGLPHHGSMSTTSMGEAAPTVVRLRTAGVALALALIGLASLASAWCGLQDPAPLRPLLMEATESKEGPTQSSSGTRR